MDADYEEPANPDLVLKAGEWSVAECVEHVINMLEEHVSHMCVLNKSHMCLN